MPIFFGGSGFRDGHLSRDGHLPSVPKQTKKSIRQAPLLSKHLFPEETVAIAGLNLRGDVQHFNLSKSLRFFTAAKQSASKKASSQSPKAKVKRTRGEQNHSRLLFPSTARVSEPPLQASDFGPISASNRRQALRLFGGMDQNRSRPMGSKNPIGGVQPPLLQSSSSHFSHLSGTLPESREKEGSSRCNEGNGDKGGDRSRTDSFSGLLQSALSSAESRRHGGL